jgi:uncharacterized protein
VTNAPGTPLWYELMSPDPDASARFYETVVGWTTRAFGGGGDYRVFESDGGQAGGLLPLSADMQAGGARPAWHLYVTSADVDASVAEAERQGGRTVWHANDLPGVGRVALVADPQGIPFYVMRGAQEATSTVFSDTALGRCSWNELNSPDPDDAIRFFGAVFGWHVGGAMPMGDLGDYSFLHAGELVLGAAMRTPPGAPSGWTFYFRVPDIDAGAAAVAAGGGKVLMGPMDVPGDDRALVATDPQGAVFGLVAKGNPA